MPFRPRTLVLAAAQTALCAGALLLVPGFADPLQFKIPAMLLGCLGLLPLLACRLQAGTHLLPGLLLFCYLFARIHPGPGQHAASLALLAAAAAFLFGAARVPITNLRLLLAVALVCAGRVLADLVTLDHLGGDPPAGHAVTTFFRDKHVTGGVLVLGALLHFHLMERRGTQARVPVLLYSSGFAVLMALVLCDSRVAQGAFLACFLPLLFLAIRLDGKDPDPERLAWVAGITLCLGLAWINLPDWQLYRTAESLAPSTPWPARPDWFAALGAAGEAPLAGRGVGTFRWASVPYLDGRPGPDGGLPVLEHAGNHYLEALAEGGAVGLALEAFLLAIALAGMAVLYFREWSLPAKYGFFALAALSLIGLHTSALDTAPLEVAYWCLIGYGWSFAAQAFPRWLMPYRPAPGAEGARRRDWIAGAATAAALALLVGWHLFHRAREFQAQRLLREARELAEIDPRKSTDRLTEALAWDPRNEEANYGYARVLAHFRRREDAVKRIAYVQGMAPDWRKRAQVLGAVYQAVGDHEQAALQAERLLAAYPDNLDALELRAEAFLAAGRCASLDSFRLEAARLAAVYPMPPSRDYTIQSLDSLFQANADIHFLQRWFAGPDLRQRFVERRLRQYSHGSRSHDRALLLRETRCPPREDSFPEGNRERIDGDAPGRISPEDGPAPRKWNRPERRPPAPRRRWSFERDNVASRSRPPLHPPDPDG